MIRMVSIDIGCLLSKGLSLHLISDTPGRSLIGRQLCKGGRLSVINKTVHD